MHSTEFPIERSTTYKIPTGCGNQYITFMNENICPQVLIQQGKSGGCVKTQQETIQRLVNLALRKGASLDEVCKEMEGAFCPKPQFYKNKEVKSCADATAIGIKEYLNEVIINKLSGQERGE